jgi:hypothetical protein
MDEECDSTGIADDSEPGYKPFSTQLGYLLLALLVPWIILTWWIWPYLIFEPFYKAHFQAKAVQNRIPITAEFNFISVPFAYHLHSPPAFELEVPRHGECGYHPDGNVLTLRFRI